MVDSYGNRNPRRIRAGRLALAATAIAAVLGGGVWLAMAKSPPKKAEPAPAAETPAPAAAAPAAAALPNVAAKLAENGAGACATQVNTLAAGAMGGVSQFNTVSKWATSAVDKRLVGVLIGQKYPGGGAVPYGATSVVAAPNAQGSCDAMAVQILPSPLPCAKLRETMATQGKQLGDLADSALMQDPAGETLLVPTSTNTCVMVGLRAAFVK